MRFILPVVVVLGSSICPLCQAATYVVKPDGSGDWPTIQQAINRSVDGDIIELAEGEFSGPANERIRFWGKAVTVTSQSGDYRTCKITHTDAGFYFIDGEGPGSVLRGVELAFDRLWFGSAVVCSSSAPTIDACKIAGGAFSLGVHKGASPTLTDCLFLGGGPVVVRESSVSLEACRLEGMDVWENWDGGAVNAIDSDVVATDCVFKGNKVYGLGGAITVGGAIFTRNSTLRLSGCVFVHNSCRLYEHGSFPGWGGAIWVSGGTTDISGCTFAKNTGQSTVSITNTVAGSFTSSIVLSSQGHSISDNGSSVQYSCLNLFGPAPWPSQVGEPGVDGNISSDPLFCDLDSNNFSLASASPCLPGNHPDGVECGLIGALGEGCATVPVQAVTWGRLKATFR